MTPSPTLSSALKELVQKWRSTDPDDAGDFMRQQCADELSAHLPALAVLVEQHEAFVKYVTSIGGIEAIADEFGHGDNCLAVIGPNISVSPECTCGLSSLRDELRKQVGSLGYNGEPK